MSASISIRFMPLIITAAILATGLRVVSLYSGFTNPLFTAASAQEVSPAQAEPEKKAQDAPPNPNVPKQEKQNETKEPQGTPQPVANTNPRDFSNFATCSEEDIRLIEKLRDRRLTLDQRAQELEIKENLLLATEVRIQDSTRELERLEGQIKSYLKLFDEREQRQLSRVVEVYSKMKPKDAAPRFEALALDIQVDLATVMEPRTVADIISEMNQKKAVALTQALATIASAPSVDDVRSGVGS